MAAIIKLQSFIIIITCLYSRSYSFKLPYNGVKIVTYGEPCHAPRYLPVTIEKPAKPVPESTLQKSYTYQPLKLNYRIISTEPISYQPRAEYPIAVQVPLQVPQPLKIITPDRPDSLRGQSYTYNVQTLPFPLVPISKKYDFDFQMPSTPISAISKPAQSVKLLTGLVSKIDRVLIPACEVPSSSCYKTDIA